MTSLPRLEALATAVPRHVVRQEDARAFTAHLFRDVLGEDPDRLLSVFEHSAIRTRRVCMPLEWFGEDHTFAEKNALYLEHALRLATEAASRLLERLGLTPRDIDHLLFVSSTGLATPSVDARLVNSLGFRSDVRRTPIWGLGCAGGAAGLARAREFALADPDSRVMLIALELCSLTFQRNDLSKRNLVAASLFADGAAAAMIAGGSAPGPQRNGHGALSLIGSSSTLWSDTLDVMGWEVDGDGLHVVFSRDIPAIVRERVRPSLAEFLGAHGLRCEDLDHVVAHPGGLKVLAAYEETLGLAPRAFLHAREVLAEYGNMSSPTCLFVLERFLEAQEIGPRQTAVLSALGPGFSAEYVLLRAEG